MYSALVRILAPVDLLPFFRGGAGMDKKKSVSFDFASTPENKVQQVIIELAVE